MTAFLRAGGLAAACLVLGAVAASPAYAADTTPSLPSIQSVAASAPQTAAAIAPAVVSPTPRVVFTAPLPVSQPAAATQPIAITQPAPAAKAMPSLSDLVISFVDRGNLDADGECLAGAIYFEARGEPLDGQLAVAQVVLNRAASGRFPTSVCQVVTQPAQFSFVRGGKIPAADRTSECWHRALAIADIARKRMLAGEIGADVLWYHATYVSPSWDRQRTRTAQIGSHIFFS